MESQENTLPKLRAIRRALEGQLKAQKVIWEEYNNLHNAWTDILKLVDKDDVVRQRFKEFKLRYDVAFVNYNDILIKAKENLYNMGLLLDKEGSKKEDSNAGD